MWTYDPSLQCTRRCRLRPTKKAASIKSDGCGESLTKSCRRTKPPDTRRMPRPDRHSVIAPRFCDSVRRISSCPSVHPLRYGCVASASSPFPLQQIPVLGCGVLILDAPQSMEYMLYHSTNKSAGAMHNYPTEFLGCMEKFVGHCLARTKKRKLHEKAANL